MRLARRHRFITVWIAALAVLMASLAPGLSQALEPEQGLQWAEICSARSLQGVQADAGQGGGDHAPGAMFEHCPYCSIHMPALGVPPQPTPVPLVLGPQATLPPGFLRAPRTTHAWVSAQPRAPPAAC